MLPLSGKGKQTCWKMFIKYVHIFTGVVRDDNVDKELEKRMSEVLMMPGIVFL